MKKILLTILIFSNMLFYTAIFASDYKYYIILDAGSTGTRLHLFKHDNNKKLPVIEDLFSEKNSIPLASFNEKPELAYEAIDTLLQNSLKKIHEKKIKSPVPISILGTAGMRLLSSDQQQKIYQNIRDEISTRYKNELTPKNIQTISGKMEGIYGWLDVNYLQRNFQNNTPTSGAIDVGGASTTIAFATEKSSRLIDETVLKLNDISYTVFSKSFLGLGLNQARESMNVDENAGFCYPTNYRIESHKGKFDLASCRLIYNQVIDNYHIDQLNLPTYKVNTFIAFSGAYYTYHFFGSDPNIPNQDTLEQTIINPTCSNTWETLKDAYPTEPEQYLANYCANGIYITNLLYGPFQLQHQQIKILSKIEENNIDWTLGALLYTIISGDA